MANIKYILSGLEIFSCYDPEGWCAAEHDILYAPDVEVTEEDAELLKREGWHWDETHRRWYIFV